MVREAMKNTDLLRKEVEWEDKYTPPAMVPDHRNWEVDTEEFEQFENVLNFLRLTLFGVCDRSSLVYACVVDRTRDAAEIPDVKVPTTDMNSTAREIQEALEAARLNLSSAQKLVTSLEGQLDRRLKKQWEREDRERKAKGCDLCSGKGWRRDPELWKTLGPGLQNHYRLLLGGYSRVLCECQKEDPPCST